MSSLNIFNSQNSILNLLLSKVISNKLVLILIFLTIIAFYLRITSLSSYGFSEDEVHKIEAIELYRHGDFSANSEHPMLMKLAMMMSLIISEKWNQHVPSHPILAETAIRFPNVVVGSLTTLVIGLIATELFSSKIGLIAAALWTTSSLAISINRIGKEDTFLVFFVWLAYFCFFHAKKLGIKKLDDAGKSCQSWWYTASGASFGLMLASKYFPHYWGLLFLWEYLDHKLRPNNPLTNPIPKFVFPRFYLAMVGSFIITNPMICSPSMLISMVKYVGEETVTHHGYVLMGVLYYNNPSHTIFSGGLPVYFYFLLITLKTLPTILFSMIVGSITVIRKSIKHSNYFFLIFLSFLWLIPFSIIGAKWMRYTLSFLPMIYIIAAIGIYKIAMQLSYKSLKIRTKNLINISVFGIFLLPSFMNCFLQSPYYSLYINYFGGGTAKAGYYFPHDEFYDAGVREAIEYIASSAPKNTIVFTETPKVFKYYSNIFNRNDLTSETISSINLNLYSIQNKKYAIVQSGRRYFENSAYIDQIGQDWKICKKIYVAGAVAAVVYST